MEVKISSVYQSIMPPPSLVSSFVCTVKMTTKSANANYCLYDMKLGENYFIFVMKLWEIKSGNIVSHWWHFARDLGETSVCLKNKSSLNLLGELTQKVKIGKKQAALFETEHCIWKRCIKKKKGARKCSYNSASLLFDKEYSTK